ncbi:Bpu10I family restriction endonuclease [Aliarcobacter butzleri]|nr:Bpu10I family restriction endonuclease [Aliarcobacter butzleri]MDK2047859.1 Bpu10I family restriction endonuclease [Aliarcobacter butzleri]
MLSVDGTKEEKTEKLVNLFNNYKFFIDYNLIFLSEDDFLYRQKGQLKLDNTVIEEFLPHLVSKVFDNLNNVEFGPTKCFSSAYFQTSLRNFTNNGGIAIRSKDQDFAIARKLYLKSSFDPSFNNSDSVTTFLGYVTAECKTNLDKTMFQEATATSHDVKSAMPGSKYFLLCEWLDMTPISTAPTDIDEVLILRKAKRISSNIRKDFDSVSARREKKDWYENFLKTNPFDKGVFLRFVQHIESVIDNDDPVENNVLNDGFF